MSLIDFPRMVLATKVVKLWKRSGKSYRAKDEREDEMLRVLCLEGALNRRAWQGVDGGPDAKYEYRPSNDTLTFYSAVRAHWSGEAPSIDD